MTKTSEVISANVFHPFSKCSYLCHLQLPIALSIYITNTIDMYTFKENSKINIFNMKSILKAKFLRILFDYIQATAICLQTVDVITFQTNKWYAIL